MGSHSLFGDRLYHSWKRRVPSRGRVSSIRFGNALFPTMPYEGYGRSSDEDVQALVAFLDSLPPIHNPLPKN